MKIKIVNNFIAILNVIFFSRPYLKEIEWPLITEQSFTVELCFILQPVKYFYTQAYM